MEKHVTYDAFKRKVMGAEEIGNTAAGRKYTVSEGGMCTSLAKYKKKIYFMPDRKSSSGPLTGRNPEMDASVVEYFRVS
jgi:hypothetical protein